MVLKFDFYCQASQMSDTLSAPTTSPCCMFHTSLCTIQNKNSVAIFFFFLVIGYLLCMSLCLRLSSFLRLRACVRACVRALRKRAILKAIHAGVGRVWERDYCACMITSGRNRRAAGERRYRGAAAEEDAIGEQQLKRGNSS